MIQYATEGADPLEIRVYPGADASFTIYEDEGDTYNYEMGKYSQIPLTWNDAAKTLTIGARTESYTGMPMTRTFNVVFVGANHGNGIGVTANPGQSDPVRRHASRGDGAVNAAGGRRRRPRPVIRVRSPPSRWRRFPPGLLDRNDDRRCRSSPG
jgi:hypothetical protein